MSEGLSELVAVGPLALAVPVALAAGAVSFFSPCCLPLVPGYLSYMTSVSGADAQAIPFLRAEGDRVAARVRGHVFVGTLLFVAGFSALFASYGAALGAVGTLLLAHQRAVAVALGTFTIFLGLLFLGAFTRIPLFGRTYRLAYHPRAGLAGAPLLGVMFGLGWTPCIGPTLAAVLSLSVTTGSAERGALLAFAYALGLGLPFLAAALAFRRALMLFGVARRHARAVMRIGGGMLIIVGLLQVSGLWDHLVGLLRSWVAGYQIPL